MTHSPTDDTSTPDGLVDVQSTPDDRGIPLRQVGIKGLRYPLVVWDRDARRQSTVGTFKMTVDLPKAYKGTHMSRFLTALEKYNGDISLETMPELVEDLRNRLDAETAHVRVDFPYFIRREAPVSKETSRLEVNAWFVGDAGERDAKFVLGVEVPVMTLCPCSKAISAYGAHCQRSRVRISIRFRELVWLEEVVAWADASGSAPIFPLLKREDEKWVTEHSYENPVFVEDLVRNVATRLRADARIEWFYVEAENEESIHAHNAYAAVYSTDLDDRG
jgi:GTP cyclohydrolase I